MKTQFYIIVFLLSVFASFAQNSVGGKRGVGNYVGGVDFNDFSTKSGYNVTQILGKFDDSSNEVVTNGKKTEGSSLLFEGWDNNGTIVLGDKNYHIKNLNYDIKKDQFLTRINQDSIFVFDFNNIDKIILNDRTFKQIYDTKLNATKIYEVIFEDENLSLLKNYSVNIIAGSPDPMLNRPNDKIKQNSSYFLYKNKLMEPFKWNKKSILGLVDEVNKDEFETYFKKNNLSYKDESDVSKVLKYFSKVDL